MLGPWKLLRQGGNGGEGGALRLHSSANRGIFVRFLFENKTLPTTPGASKRGGNDEGMRRLKWIGFVRIHGVCVSTTNALISASRQRSSSPSISGYAREITALSRNYSIVNDTRLHFVNIYSSSDA